MPRGLDIRRDDVTLHPLKKCEVELAIFYLPIQHASTCIQGYLPLIIHTRYIHSPILIESTTPGCMMALWYKTPNSIIKRLSNNVKVSLIQHCISGTPVLRAVCQTVLPDSGAARSPRGWRPSPPSTTVNYNTVNVVHCNIISDSPLTVQPHERQHEEPRCANNAWPTTSSRRSPLTAGSHNAPEVQLKW